jgi:DNA-binding transcriptional ArsR family regulator
MATLAGFAPVAAALGDPAREAILAALIGGDALPAGELATAAGLSPSGASAHLQKLLDVGIVAVVAQGRFRYYRIADEQVGEALEALANITDRARVPDTRRKRQSAALCFARSCYTHLAGRLGVALADALERQQIVAVTNRTATLTSAGRRWLYDFGVEPSGSRGSDIRLCLDWTERRRHFAGPLASALLTRLLTMNYLERRRDGRELSVTPSGQIWFRGLGIDVTALLTDRDRPAPNHRVAGRPLTSAPASGAIFRKNGTDKSEITATPIKAG